MTYQEWHETAWKAKLLAQASIKVVSYLSAMPEDKAIAQEMFDHLWKMGFRPEKG